MRDEFALDPALLARLKALAPLEPAARVAPLLAVVRGHHEHSAPAICLLVALREAGAALAGTGFAAGFGAGFDSGSDGAAGSLPVGFSGTAIS